MHRLPFTDRPLHLTIKGFVGQAVLGSSVKGSRHTSCQEWRMMGRAEGHPLGPHVYGAVV